MSTEPGDGLRLGQQGPVGVVSLARPPVNAVTFDLLERLADILSRPERWFPEATALVLAGDGPHFSAGMDRAELAILDRDRLTRAAAALAAVLHRPLPLVAAVHGSAAGTGFILAACADLLVIDPQAKVWLPEVEIGMLGGAGHARRWLPMPLVRRMTLHGDEIPGTTLHQHGALRPPDESTALETGLEAARRLAGRDPSLLTQAREVLAGLESDAAATHHQEMQATPIPKITTVETDEQ